MTTKHTKATRWHLPLPSLIVGVWGWFFSFFILHFSLFILLPTTLHADILKGRVVDAETKEPVPEASVELEQRMDYNGHMAIWHMSGNADSLGYFTFALGGRGTLTASMLGYYPKTKVVMGFSNDTKDTLDIGDIALKPSETLLKMLDVKGRARRFTVMGDTIVFHPEAFHLQEGARLDELIKQLPGVQVEDDGTMTWNGKPIRITMDGESLFGGSDIINQLPAEAVQDIKAYNKASKFSERTGKDDGSEDMVLDLTIKPGFLDRWYGDITAAYQTKDHYDTDLSMRRLSKTNPAMISAYANNIDKQRRRTMSGGWGNWGNGFGQSQGASAGYQHNWREKEGTQEKRSNYNFSGGLLHADRWNTSGSETENFMEGAAVKRSTSESYNREHTMSPFLNGELTWDIDTLNSIRFHAGIEHKQKRDNSWTDTEQEGLLSQLTRSHGKGHETSFQTSGTWYRFMENDATLGASYSVNYNDGTSEQWTDRDVTPLTGGSVFGDSIASLTESRSQYAHTPTSSVSIEADAHYGQWLTKRWLMGTEYRVDYNRNRSRQTFETDGVTDAANSYRDHNNRMRHGLDLTSTIDLSPVKLMPRLSTKWVREHQDYQRGQLDTTATRRRLLVEPSVRATWKVTKTIGFDLNYSFSTSQPSLISTLAYRDQTNPLFITEGNPLLRDTHTNAVSLGFNGIASKQQLSIGVNVSYRTSDREIRNAQTYQPSKGIYTSRPENVRGSQSWDFRLNYDQGFGDIIRLQNDFRLSARQQYAFLTQLIPIAATTPLPNSGGIGGEATLNRQSELHPVNRLSLTADWAWLKVTAFGQLDANRLRYSDSPDQNTTIWSNRFGVDGELTRGHFVVKTSLTEEMYSGYTVQGMNRNMLLWDASVTWKFLKNKAQLSLELDDILNAQDSRWSSQTAFQQTTSWHDIRHHYIGLSFTYHLDAKAKE